MRGTRNRFASDEGMTIVEVVIASAILFFIMTAIIGLLGRTIAMANQSVQMNDVNNAIGTYTEWMRDIAFADLPSIESTTIAAGDYTVQIVPTVEDGENEYLKNVWLAVTVTQPNGFLRVVNTMVVIRDRDQYMSQGSQGPKTDPTIVFLAASPPDQTVVWLSGGMSYWKDSSGVTRPFKISARAIVTEGRTIDEVSFQLEDKYYLTDAITHEPAHWLNPTWTDTPLFSVDLGQVNTDGVPIFAEGLRSVQAFVKDSEGVIRQDVRQYLVDNRAPDKPPWPVTLDDKGPSSRIWAWPLVMDGTTPSYGYITGLRQQPLAPVASWTDWPRVNVYSGPATAYLYEGKPMSRYLTNVSAFSPRGLATAYGAASYLVTRPTLTGTYVIKKRTAAPSGWTVDASLTATAPSFESTGTTYEWYEGTTLLATTTANTYSASVSVDGDPIATTFPARTYSVVVTTKPLGLPSNTANAPVSRTSNAISTVANVAGTYTFTEGTW